MFLVNTTYQYLNYLCSQTTKDIVMTDIATIDKPELMIFNKGVMSRQISNMNLIAGGNKKIFTPEQLKDHAIEYFTYCNDNPIKSSQLITGGNKGGEVVKIDKPRMFTIEGFCLWCGINTKYLYQLDEQVRDKTDVDSLRYSYIINYIRESIRNQRFELAAVNELNPMFIAKLENLSDKVEHSGNIDQTVTHIEFIQRTIEDIPHINVQNLLESE